MTGFVLVHMSCAGAWAWGDGPDRLRAAGHEALAPDLDLSPGQTPASHTAAVAAAASGDGCFAPDEAADERLVPMPISAFEAPAGFTPRDLPHTFVHCTRSDMGDQAARARERGWTVIQVGADHLLPLEQPELVARLLTQSS